MRIYEAGIIAALGAGIIILAAKCFALAMHPAALPLSSPFGAYGTRAEAISAARDTLERGATCVKVEAVNDTATELQPC